MGKFDLYYETGEQRRFRQVSWRIYKYLKYNPRAMKTAEIFDVYKKLHVFFIKRNMLLAGGFENGLMLTELFAGGEGKTMSDAELANAANMLGDYIEAFEENYHLLVLPDEKNEDKK